MRYLTKSRYKLAKECPTKLFYTGKRSEYYDTKMDNDFLMALAEGGFQVGELAKYYYPGGINIDTLESDKAIAETNTLLQQEEVIIYEAAFRFETLLIRADIVIKKGSQIQLIEVKSKSIDPRVDTFVTKKNAVRAEWEPYLYDIAFQKYVVTRSHPVFSVSAYLLLADKSSIATVDGLNQLFLISEVNGRAKVTITSEITPAVLGGKILHLAGVDDIIDRIWKEPANFGSFAEEVQFFATNYFHDTLIGPWIGDFCSRCEFTPSNELISQGYKSGFNQCWKRSGLTEDQLNETLVLRLWNSRKKQEYLAGNKYFLKDLTRADLESNASSPRQGPYLSRIDRQELQIQKCKDKDPLHFIDVEGLRIEMASWHYPLHFIDFETTSVAIPFNAGRRPYEQVAFQFSHHILLEDGTVKYADEWIHSVRGAFPNYDFIRTLKLALEKDNGTIFRYAAHENTILNVIYSQLKNSTEKDKEILCDWIKTITHSSSSNADTWKGERDMKDLRDIVLWYYYHPLTSGSNSIKEVLPAILSCSDFLQRKYERPIYGNEIVSANFTDHSWITYDSKGVILNPYKLLPPIYEGIDNDLLDDLVMDEAAGIADGGAAMMAYARMQFSRMTDAERQTITAALKRYCELDTLAMVMIVEAWKDWCK